MAGVIKEFREFILRGNVVDLAIAVVLGAAFGAVVAALVADIITPLVAAVFGQPDFGALSFTINGSKFAYGHFINTVITFVTVAAAVFFLIVKPMNVLLARRKAKEEPAPESPTEDILLLTEIRDLLRAGAR
jgi:large conductance mechanosensitive channel